AVRQEARSLRRAPGFVAELVRFLGAPERKLETTVLARRKEHGAASRFGGLRRFETHPLHELFERSCAAHRALELEEKFQMPHALFELLFGVEQLHVLLHDRQEEAAVVDRDGGSGGERMQKGSVVGRESAAGRRV